MKVSCLGGEYCYIAIVEFNIFLSLFPGAERDLLLLCVVAFPLCF